MSLDRDKLTRVLRLLESSHDGEVLAAVEAIKRMMASAGMKITDLAGGNAVDQAAYQLMRASMDAERRSLDRQRQQLAQDIMRFEQERDAFELERQGADTQQAKTPTPDDTLTMAKLQEAIRKSGLGADSIYVDPFAPYRANEYTFNRPNYEQQRYYEEEHEQTGGKEGWTEKTSWDDTNRTRDLHDGITEKWERWARVDVARAGWILGHRYTNQVAQQAFAFVCKHGRLHPMQQQTIDVYMRHGR